MTKFDVDFMNFGDVRLFMPTDDNLYNLYDPSMRGYPLFAHYGELEKHGRIPYPLSPERLRQTRHPHFALPALLQALTEGGCPIDLLDVGAFVGLVGIRTANLSCQFGLDIRVECFDPSLAGTLIPHNIAANRLGDAPIRHIDKAVSIVDGPILFSYTPGHMDGDAIRWRRTEGSAIHFPVPSVTFSKYLAERQNDRHLLVKIDTEGIDPLLVQQLYVLRLPLGFSAIMEFTPRHYASYGLSPSGFLSDLAHFFHIVEFFHFPQISRIRAWQAQDIEQYAAEVEAYPHRHTDLLLLWRQLPLAQRLLDRLAEFTDVAPSPSLTLVATDL